MAQYGGEQYGREGRQTDEFGNPVRKTDEYGREGRQGQYGEEYGREGRQGQYGEEQYGREGLQPTNVDLPGGTGSHYGSTGGTGHDTGVMGGQRTGEYGYTRGGGGRDESGHEKGVIEKIKEKLPGSGHRSTDEQRTTTTTTATGGGEYAGEYGYSRGGGEGQTHEKKGVMDKIKEKLPGQRQ